MKRRIIERDRENINLNEIKITHYMNKTYPYIIKTGHSFKWYQTNGLFQKHVKEFIRKLWALEFSKLFNNFHWRSTHDQ